MFLPIPVPEVSAYSVEQGKPWRVVCCGSPQIEHRGHKIFQALQNLEEELPVVWLVSSDEEKIASELVEEFDLSAVEVRTGRTPANWKSLVEESHFQNIAIHTHFSVYRQTGPYFQLSLAAGLPTLISDFGGGEFYPDALTFKIEPGDTEASQIAEVLSSLTSGKVTVESQNVQAFATDHFVASHVADELTFALQKSLPDFKECLSKWGEIEADARKDTLSFSLEKNFGRAEQELFSGHNGGRATKDLNEVFKELGFL